jgi:POT family proton-dependent oligopeptide transporter
VFVDVLYLALALIIMGVGFLKANISSIVGQLYRQGDPRRDPGFTLYYYGINLGAFWAAILCGYLGRPYGWRYGFGLAGVGMLAGYVTFMLGKPLLQGRGEPPDPARWPAPRRADQPGMADLLARRSPGSALVWLPGPAQRSRRLALASVRRRRSPTWALHGQECGKVERERLFLAFVLIAGSIVFFTLFEQAATSLNLFAERNTQLALIGRPAVFSLLGQPLFFGDQGHARRPRRRAPGGSTWASTPPRPSRSTPASS